MRLDLLDMIDKREFLIFHDLECARLQGSAICTCEHPSVVRREKVGSYNVGVALEEGGRHHAA